ncbi:MAG: KpsF/GutQ family sugar-phosphate isomerase [Bacteroidetes bacterium]|jgi:arabinose-5-phosphate isomerase|nr:KpsF/GutQ family sugar-phosphate isomerase [Bacteroidota bacterium]
MLEKDLRMDSTLEKGKEVIRIEADAVAALIDRINDRFVAAVQMIFMTGGRVVITGMGKSGLIARKIAATMSSTGTPAVFMHPSDAFHGDLGMVQSGDVVICISKSGDTEEIQTLLPILRHLGAKVISMVGNVHSFLGRNSDVVLDVSVKEEACPHDLAPTASTTATLAMGDALAIALLHKRNFTKEDFALFHPGGILGRQLLLKVESLMVTGSGIPSVHESVTLSDAILVISSKRLGATCVVNDGGQLSGIITDGDLRRLLQRTNNITNLTAADAMTKNPKVIRRDMLAARALEMMESHKITQLVVVDEETKPAGMIHLHDLVKAGFTPESNG